DDLPDALELRVLACPAGPLSAKEAASAALSEAPSRGAGTYAVQAGACVCFEVYNRSSYDLRVTLVNAAASGAVQMLRDQTLAQGTSYRFWLDNDLGSPFVITPPQPGKPCIDRLVAIGRTDLYHELEYLKLDLTFAQVIGVPRDMGGAPRSPSRPLERWAA